jgi:hypothetical protein
VLDLPGPPTRLAVGSGAVFVLFGASNVPQRVARFDPRTGSAVWGPVLKGAHDLGVAGGRLWVSGGGVLGYGRPATRFLYRLDPSTLEVLGRVVLPEPAYPLAPSPAGMWVGANDALYLVDPRTGHIDRTIPLKGTVGQISVDEQTGILYDSTHPVGDATIQAVEERDLATGGASTEVLRGEERTGDELTRCGARWCLDRLRDRHVGKCRPPRRLRSQPAGVFGRDRDERHPC